MIVNKYRNKYKHLTISERATIDTMLNNRATFKEIAAALGKDACTVSREVRKHRVFAENSFIIYDEQNRILNDECLRLDKPPYVCNGCPKRHGCRCVRYLYNAKKAQAQYEAMLRDSREGIPLNHAEFYEIDAQLTSRLKNGQHLYQAIKSTGVDIAISTAYRYAEKGYFSFTSMDLPRKVKFKNRKQKGIPYVAPLAKKGRTYEDFMQYIEANGITDWVEMDTVIGRPGGKVILTLHFTICNFMVGILLDSKSALAVTQAFKRLREKFSAAKVPFSRLFPLILTDNGGEFSNISAIENNAAGERETRLFFCDAMKSCQKPRVEKNHTLLRDICPKGTSFDHMTQAHLNIIFSHMNSTARRQFHGKTPYQLFCYYFGKEMADLLEIREVPADKVIQTPKLLKLLKS